MAVINIDDAYILNETGAQVDKVTGLFTKDEDTTRGEKAFAQLNIGTAGSNRNLLDNPWFTAGNVVNQRGFSSMASAGGYKYIVDRWMVNNSGATLGSDGITIEPAANDYGLIQRIERSRLVEGETYTLSVIINGTLYTRTFVWDSNKYLPTFYGTVRAYINNPNDNPVMLWIVGRPGDSFTISKIKLELGSVSTLANDAPPDYGEELLKCLRYQWVVDTESVYGVVGDATVTTQNTEAMMVVHYPVPMYKVPTLSVSGAFRTIGGNGSAIVVGSVTSMTVTSNASNKNFARVTINGTTMGGTGTSVVVGANGAGAKLIFDANI